MQVYRLELHTTTQRKLRSLPERLRIDVAETILALREDPYPPYSKPLRRELQGRRTIRIGGLRIIYAVYTRDHRVVIWDIRVRNAGTYLNIP